MAKTTPDPGATPEDDAVTPEGDAVTPEGEPDADTEATPEDDQASDGEQANEALVPDDGVDDVVLIRAGYGRDCATCGTKMLGGQRLALDEERQPIHGFCA